MMGHKICFNGEIWIIIPKLSQLPLLVRSIDTILILSMLRGPYSLLRMLPQRYASQRQPGLPALCSTATTDGKKTTKAVIFDMGGVLVPSPLLMFKGKIFVTINDKPLKFL